MSSRPRVRSAAEETDRLARLAEDLLVIARVDEGRAADPPDAARATTVLEPRRRSGSRRGTRGGATPDGLDLQADPLRLEQALGNLVDNALRHGGTHVELSGRARERPRRAARARRRAGIPARVARRRRSSASRAATRRAAAAAPASGWRSSTSIAGAHGGAAGARNRPGGGADVWIAVPCAS